jgi:hypothetical protein
MTGIGTPSIQSKIPRPMVVSIYAGVACSVSIRGRLLRAHCALTSRTGVRPHGLTRVPHAARPSRATRATHASHPLTYIGVLHPRWFQGLLEGGVLERTPCFACSAACCTADSLGASVAVSGFNFVSSLAVSGPLDCGSVAVSG